MRFWEQVKDLVENPLIKVISAAFVGLFSTPIVLIVGIIIMWTFEYFSRLYAISKRNIPRKRLSRLKSTSCYDKLIVHLIFLMMITVLANMLNLKFVQLWGYSFVAITEAIQTTINLFGHKRAVKIFRDLTMRAGLDITESKLPEDKDDV